MASISAAALADGLSQLQQIFSKTDKDGDGSLSKTEFTAAVKNIPGLGDSSSTDKIFAQLDKDGDGKISSDELTQGAKLASKVQDALLKAQELMSGSTLMDIIGGKSAMAQAKAAAAGNNGDIANMFTSGDSSGATDDSGINALIQQIMNSYNANTGQTTGTDTKAATGTTPVDTKA